MKMRLIALLACLTAFAAVGVTAASAGEVNKPHGYIAGSDSAPLNGCPDGVVHGVAPLGVA